MNFEEFELGLNKIGYSISRDLGDYRVVDDNFGKELDLVVWFEKEIEIEVGDKQKIRFYLDKCTIGISSNKTFSFGALDKSVFFQLYNHENK